MNPTKIDETAALLADSWRAGRKIDELPERLRVADLVEAHAIQDAMVAALGERVAGWKVGAEAGGTVARGAIVSSRVYRDGAKIPAKLMPLMGIEPEIAFRFDAALPPRAEAYSHDEVAAACSAFLAVEVVDSRFTGYPDNPLADKVADLVSNGGFVEGAAIPDWRARDLVNLRVTVELGATVAGDQTAGHVRGHPLLPAVDLVNQMRRGEGVLAGTFMTTGTYCGLVKAEAAVPVVCRFDDLGTVELSFT